MATGSRRLWRRAKFATAAALFALGGLAASHAEDIGTAILYQIFDWMSGGDFSRPINNIPIDWSLAEGNTVTQLVGTQPVHFWGVVADCKTNFPFTGAWPGPNSGAQWTTWSQRAKTTTPLYLAGAFVREGAWLDSISTQCTSMEADGSWKDKEPLPAMATRLDTNGIPTTQFNALLMAVMAIPGGGGTGRVASCPRNSYVYGFNAIVALEKNAIARVRLFCIDPLTGKKSYSGITQTNNSDGTNNGLTYRLFPTTSQTVGFECPDGQLGTGWAGYRDTGDVANKSMDHITAVGLVCQPYTINRPPVMAELGTDRPGNDIDQPAMSAADPNLCEAACNNNSECKSWTYVIQNFRGEPQCFLKKPLPVAVKDPCCVSGVKPPAFAGVGQNRKGANYYHADNYAADPNVCAEFCKGSTTCKSWTYVKPGVQGDNAVCWYKNAEPPATKDPCCISGLKNPLMGQKPSGDKNATGVPVPVTPPGLDTIDDAVANGGAVVLHGIPEVARPAPGVTFGGTWLTRVQNGKLYTVALSQGPDGKVAGSYEAGTIRDGVVIGNELYAHWQQGDAMGTLLFTIAPDNAAFAGTWTNGDYMPTLANAGGTWDGYRKDIFTGVPGGDDFTGTWTVTQSDGASYEMTLTQNGSTVTGTYDATGRNGTIAGHDDADNMVLPHLVFDPAKTPGEGWSQAGNGIGGGGWFYLYPDRSRFSGIWRMADKSNGAWSAVRKTPVVVATTEPAAPPPAPVAIVPPKGACPAPQPVTTEAVKVHRGTGDAIPDVTLAGGMTVACLACNRTWCLIASADLDAGAAGQSPTVGRKYLDFGPPPVAGNDTPPPPPESPPLATQNFAGEWVATSGRGNCYDWHLEQTGASVSGYYNPLSAVITGTVTGNVLNFDWTEHDANSNTTGAGSGRVTLTGLDSFGGQWWTPAAPDQQDPANVWQAMRRVSDGGGCSGMAQTGGGKFNLPLSKFVNPIGDSEPVVDVGGSANDNPAPPVVR